jgi:L-fuculose-phosphate aldolase
MTRKELEDQLVHYSHQMHRMGWVANHDGNVSVCLSEDRFLITPTALSKATITRSQLIVVNEQSQVISGRHKPFSELALHLYIYRNRQDVRVVMHSHAPYATGLAVSGQEVLPTMLPEAIVSLGERIPLIPYAAPKTPEWTMNLGPYMNDADACTLENHGVLSFGPDLETAYLRMELVEHLARIQCIAKQAGEVRTVPQEDVENLLKARTKAGLGAAARTQAKAKQDLKATIEQSLRGAMSR